MAQARTRPEGFTLIEILVALAVAVVLSAPLLHIFSGGLGALGRAQRSSTAALWAESLLDGARAETPLAPGVRSGDLAGGYHWERTVTPYRDEGMSGDGAQGFVLYAIEVTVYWREGVGRSAFTLRTLALALRPKG